MKDDERIIRDYASTTTELLIWHITSLSADLFLVL
ncbi:hypothetical protein C5167_042840 [Papaver somniferum]|uniref:Uncharacterized protein n=1 Tax=Papaver somniferum TaxID=3469 RepID=A0A4Y7L5P7_PAPSO|nr:hypothetical protein C5167_042840 [Papaver somniferum]